MAEVELNAGPHGFMMLSVKGDGYILQRLDPEMMPEPSFRFVLSSQPIAACIQKIDCKLGLDIPLTMSIQEILLRPRRFPRKVRSIVSTVVRYILPSSLITTEEVHHCIDKAHDDYLLCAANNLDKMFEALVEFMCASDEIPRASL